MLELDQVAPSDEISAQAAQVTAPPAKFAALRNRDCRPYLFGAALAMMADNVEHVITYWVLWQKFHSPALAGFEVISHWVPFLLFSVYFGSLADRYDCRRLIQGAQALFMLVSALWGVLFLTHSLRVWEACLLLVLHGCAGALWGPGEQLMLHNFVGREELPSAVRLNATFRSLGVLFGPVVGSALLLGLGPVRGIFVNIAIYLPLTLFLFRTKFTGHLRDHGPRPPRVGMLGSLRVLKDVRSDHTLVSMIILGGLGSFFIGTSLQTAMPLFAQDLEAGSAGLAYGVLLFANGAGGVIGGILLEATGSIKPNTKAAVVSTAVYGVTTLFFALTGSYLIALALLFLGRIANLAAMSIGQTIVQLRAAPADRGRVVGLYGVSANGLRAGSGFTVGILGVAIGIHASLGFSAAALCLGTVAAGIYALRGRGAGRAGSRWRGRPGGLADLVAEELVHGGDLGVVAGEGELGQVPGVLDGAEQRVVVVGGVADEVTGPARIDHHRGHQAAAVQAAGQLALMSGSPPAGPGSRNSRPGVPAAVDALPVKSPSSATMKMALCRVQARLDMIVVTAPLTKASAFCLSRMSFASSLVLLNGHGVSGWPPIASFTPPCMSLHWSGVMNTNRGARGLFRSPARAVYGLMFATRAGLARMSVKSTNGLCLDAYSGLPLDGQNSVPEPTPAAPPCRHPSPYPRLARPPGWCGRTSWPGCRYWCPSWSR